MTAPDPNAFLMGGGTTGKSASFKERDTVVEGVICAPPETRQQIDPETNKPDTWDDGGPKWQIVVPLQTDQRNPELEHDDGVRYLYVRGSKKPESKSLHAAVAGAIQAAGAAGLEIGGKLRVKYVGDGVASSRAFTPPKKYEATYTSAANVALATESGGAATQLAAPPTTTTTVASPAGDEPPANVDASIKAAWANLPEQTKAMFREAS